jgi:hypothetical protein
MKKAPSNGSHGSAANPRESEIVKEKITFESALREEGIDEVFVARGLKDLLRAQGRRWNPKKGSWEKCEDYGTQLAALREIAKIFGIYGKDSEGADMPLIIDISAIPIHRELASPSDGAIEAQRIHKNRRSSKRILPMSLPCERKG